MTDKESARVAGAAAADAENALPWAAFGFLVPVVAVLVVHLRSPRLTALAMLGMPDDREAARIYTAQYLESLKARQTAHTWVGAFVGGCITLLYIGGALF